MQYRILAIAAVAAAIGLPAATSAQTVGVAPGPGVPVTSSEGIAVEQRPAFREYVIRERIPTYTVPDRVVVGADLTRASLRLAASYNMTPELVTVADVTEANLPKTVRDLVADPEAWISH